MPVANATNFGKKIMDPSSLKSELRRRSAGRPAEAVTTSADVAHARKTRKTKAYGEKSYWDARYSGEDVSEDYDWLCGWAALRPTWEREVGRDGTARVLHTGCGNSNLGSRLVEEGHAARCVNVDYSHEVVARMARAYPACEWVAGDCTDMVEFRRGEFDAVLDKGTLDAMACNDDARRAVRRGRMYVSECFRVLAPGGVLLVVSFGQPETRLKYFRGHDTACDWARVDHAAVAISVEIKMFRIRSTWSNSNGFGERDQPDLEISRRDEHRSKNEPKRPRFERDRRVSRLRRADPTQWLVSTLREAAPTRRTSRRTAPNR